MDAFSSLEGATTDRYTVCFSEPNVFDMMQEYSPAKFHENNPSKTQLITQPININKKVNFYTIFHLNMGVFLYRFYIDVTPDRCDR